MINKKGIALEKFELIVLQNLQPLKQQDFALSNFSLRTLSNFAKFSLLSYLVLTILLVNLATAEFWACFNKAEVVDFCNPKTHDRTCGGTNGCLYCMDSFDEENNCYNQGNFNICNTLPPECTLNRTTPHIDSEPPALTILSPVHDSVYNKKLILLDILTNEISDISYIDNIKKNIRWKRLCKNCISYNKNLNFNEGFNDVSFKAEDSIGNTEYKNVSFYIDTKKPKITKVSPKEGLASSIFFAQFTEENPISLKLNYGNNSTNYNTYNLDLTNECILDRGKYNCKTSLDLSQYDGQTIFYWFELTDIAGNSASSKPIILQVDTTSPIINSLLYTIHKNHLMLKINITEQNFNKVEYIDKSASRPRWKTLCSSLSNRICNKIITLNEGPHNIEIKVSDKAGNSVSQNLNINIES